MLTVRTCHIIHIDYVQCAYDLQNSFLLTLCIKNVVCFMIMCVMGFL